MALVSILGTQYFTEKCCFAHETTVNPMRLSEKGQNCIIPPIVRVHEEGLSELYLPDLSVVSKICRSLLSFPHVVSLTILWGLLRLLGNQII